MPVCPNCGSQIEERSSFCPACGTNLIKQPNKKFPYKLVILIIFGLVVIGLIILSLPSIWDYVTVEFFGGKKDCGYDYSCFINFAKKGLPVSMRMNRTVWEENVTFYIENKGIEENKANIYVSVEKASGYLKEVEGDGMNCIVQDEADVNLSSLNSKICSICSGTLIDKLTTIKKDCGSNVGCFLKSAEIGRPSFVRLSQAFLSEKLSAYFEIHNIKEKRCEAAAELYAEVEETPTALQAFKGKNMTCTIENGNITDFKPENCNGSLVNSTIFSFIQALMQK